MVEVINGVKNSKQLNTGKGSTSSPSNKICIRYNMKVYHLYLLSLFCHLYLLSSFIIYIYYYCFIIYILLSLFIFEILLLIFYCHCLFY